MGKSRLIAEFVRDARRRGLFVAFGECQSFGTNTSYFVWREIRRRIFGLEDAEPSPGDRAQIEATLVDIDPALLERAPLLSTVVGIDIPENDLTSALDAKVRKASLEDLIVTCLRARTGREPVVLVLEDCHWIDVLSRDLLEVVGRARPTCRSSSCWPIDRRASPAAGSASSGSRTSPRSCSMSSMPTRRASSSVSSSPRCWGSRWTRRSATRWSSLVTDRARRQPVLYRGAGQLHRRPGRRPDRRGRIRAVQLPESLHSLVLSRIDTMAEGPRRTLKVASVVGRVFEAPTLPGAYPELGTWTRSWTSSTSCARPTW